MHINYNCLDSDIGSWSMEEKSEFALYVQSCLDYINFHSWAEEIASVDVEFFIPGIIIICKLSFEKPVCETDNCLWVVSGDIPPIYSVGDDIKNYKDALVTYINFIEGWICAAKCNGLNEQNVKIDLVVSPENIADLESRMNFLKQNFLDCSNII